LGGLSAQSYYAAPVRVIDPGAQLNDQLAGLELNPLMRLPRAGGVKVVVDARGPRK